METHAEHSSDARVSMRDVIHRVNNLVATMLAESELALLTGTPAAQESALRRVVGSVDKLRTYLADVQRREEASCD